jgi:hypothetical protein
MGASDVLQLAGQWGPMGLLVAYLVWDKQQQHRQRHEEMQAKMALEEKEIASRERLASSLTALSMVIQGRANI